LSTLLLLSSIRGMSKSQENETWILGSCYAGLFLDLFDIYLIYLLEKQTEEIRSHSRSLMRLTYRSSFPPLSPYNMSSDAGWGCMLRSAQMIMAQVLQRHFLGKGLSRNHIRGLISTEWRLPAPDLCRVNSDYYNVIDSLISISSLVRSFVGSLIILARLASTPSTTSFNVGCSTINYQVSVDIYIYIAYVKLILIP
jgi:hypothetical protein